MIRKIEFEDGLNDEAMLWFNRKQNYRILETITVRVMIFLGRYQANGVSKTFLYDEKFEPCLGYDEKKVGQ